MYRSFVLASALSLGLTAASSAASIFVSDFTGTSSGDALSGTNGWGQSEANDDDLEPLAWVSSLTGTPAASVGAYYAAPGSTSFYASNSVGTAFTTSTISLQFGLQDSTTDYPFRNNFGFSLVNGAGDNLFSVNLTTTNQGGIFDDPSNPVDPETSDANWNLSVTSIGMAAEPAFVAVGEDSFYTVYVEFTSVGADINYKLYFQGTVGPTVIDTGTLAGLSSETISQFRVNFSQGTGQDWGDNILTFRAVPEPSALLLSGLAGLAFLRRRRR
ncbi:PEP-CTERM sorting domain-containing protein [Luteolibacter flavescens]|uniref:PEP-CTERM sorting domain-containing protein n=1 Tax=Luteolibacter flavescens TaxID=1859460 RepID=A0ABT3FUS3_9BACT|nr:PEP-CTERM sorting domain-containing protein [Luteolibacter flavescens]MCW1887326.1 PEP-CTERM sorting domain-containing protein [Luteolibacter flavescens]